jgi:hypothetical protein
MTKVLRRETKRRGFFGQIFNGCDKAVAALGGVAYLAVLPVPQPSNPRPAQTDRRLGSLSRA